MQYFQVKVQFNLEDGKKKNVLYLVDAQSVTESEVRITEFLINEGEQAFEVKSSSESKIHQVVEQIILLPEVEK